MKYFEVQVSTYSEEGWQWHRFWIEGQERAKRFTRRVHNLRTVVQAGLTGETLGD